MDEFSLTHLSDGALTNGLRASTTREGAATATVLAHIAEFDARRLYVPAAMPSMHAYCVNLLHLSEDAAYKRIQAARAARTYPAIFKAVAEARLHLTGVGLLVPHLTPENADNLLAAAELKTKAEIERLIAERFPRSDVPESVRAVPPAPVQTSPVAQLAPAQVMATAAPSGQPVLEPIGPVTSGRTDSAPQLSDPSPLTVGDQLAPAQVTPPDPLPRATPLAPGRYALQFTVDEPTYVQLREVQALLGHQLPSRNLAVVFSRALKLLHGELQKAKFAATSRPRPQRRGSSARHIPAEVKRRVWERDGGQCTFVSDRGQRCPARTRLEYDHVDPVGRGGEARVSRVRLRCRAHNQYDAERTYGAEFMRHKRESAQRARAARRETPSAPEGLPGEIRSEVCQGAASRAPGSG